MPFSPVPGPIPNVRSSAECGHLRLRLLRALRAVAAVVIVAVHENPDDGSQHKTAEEPHIDVLDALRLPDARGARRFQRRLIFRDGRCLRLGLGCSNRLSSAVDVSEHNRARDKQSCQLTKHDRSSTSNYRPSQPRNAELIPASLDHLSGGNLLPTLEMGYEAKGVYVRFGNRTFVGDLKDRLFVARSSHIKSVLAPLVPRFVRQLWPARELCNRTLVQLTARLPGRHNVPAKYFFESYECRRGNSWIG